ncbi:hypothetical protein A4S02_10555 [Acetobacter ascendens]|uniref:Uncharacterized protein n=1 Tax=Acetobacter ascendens TaxID=481146 RepID=A0A1D8QXR5_9PROT|nr:hypothetical protein [Acetobacter ascendens]AOW47131.1 hypothetical protein A4S02_10555 [Acetobacter ascendens]
MSDQLEQIGLDYGDNVRSKTHPEWGILFVHDYEGGLLTGNWISTHGVPEDRPKGIALDDMEYLSSPVGPVQRYSDFEGQK